MSDVRLVVGLGNPGSEYAQTRHNVGFKVVEAISELLDIQVNKKKFAALFGQGLYQGKQLMLLMPQQYMNRSGQAVATAVGFYKLGVEDILVVTDDMAFEPGVIRLKAKGSAGGHNGLADIIAKLGTDKFSRLRVGIGASGRIPGRNYVLGKVPDDQKEIMNKGILMARDAALCWAHSGIDEAMNKYNVRPGSNGSGDE